MAIRLVYSAYRENYIADENMIYGYHAQIWEINITNQIKSLDDQGGENQVIEFEILDKT